MGYPFTEGPSYRLAGDYDKTCEARKEAGAAATGHARQSRLATYRLGNPHFVHETIDLVVRREVFRFTAHENYVVP